MGKFNKSGAGSRRGRGAGARPGKKTFKPGAGKPARFKKSSGSSSDRERSFDRPAASERSSRPFKKDGDREKRAFPRSSRPAEGEFRPRSEGDREKRPYQKRSDSGDREKRPYQKRSDSGDGEKRPYQKRSDSGDREKRPYQKRSDSGDGAKRPYQKRSESGDREKRPYQKRSDSGDGAKRPYQKRSDSGDREKRPYQKRTEETSERPFQKRSDSGEKRSRPFTKRSGGDDRPFDKKSSGEGFYVRKESKPRDDFESKGGDREGDGERAPTREKREKFAKPESERKSFSGLKRDESSSPRPRIRRDDANADRRSYKGRREESPRRNSDSEGADAPKWNRKESHEFFGDNKKPGKFQKGPRKPKVTAADEGLTRLNKFISNAGICSRREADEMIKAGVITVNGEVVVEMGYKVQPGDVVKYNNETLRGERLVYILLNKPKDFITTTDDPEERKTVMSLIASAGKERVYPVGRLDRNTTGLLLFTNDGDLARKLTHPSFEVQKVYQVELDKSLKTTDMQAILDGLTLEDGFIKVDDVAFTSEEKSVLGVELHSGRNRIVRRIFEHLGYTVKKLDRVIFAGLTKKDLPRGRWRYLSEMELANLKMMTGSKKFSGMAAE
ncbi:MAG: RNA-binding S4 domain-containing protein [Bacteroidetes bacterium]|nr:RNA-binding S4 domain-containing protein [Bacteroidota bacterium]